MQIGEALDETVVQRMRDSFASQGLMRLMGAEMTTIRAGEVTIIMPFRDDLTQHDGYFHAGGSSAIADSAGGYAAYTMFDADSSVLTVEFKLNLMNPGQGERLEAVGRVIKPGRTLTVCQLDVWGVTGERRVHVATGLQTLMQMRPRR